MYKKRKKTNAAASVN